VKNNFSCYFEQICLMNHGKKSQKARPVTGIKFTGQGNYFFSSSNIDLVILKHFQLFVTRIHETSSSQTTEFSKSTIFWDIRPCSPLKGNCHFGGTYHVHLQGWISQARYQCESRWQAPLQGRPKFLSVLVSYSFIWGLYESPVVSFYSTVSQ
jgi:hypothetical protein